MPSDRLRITQTLISAWQYALIRDEGYDSFLQTLNREKAPPTKAMLDGQHFEGMVNAALDGNEPPKDHELYEQVMACEGLLRGSQKQVNLFAETEVDGQPFLLHGVLDFLKAGVIYDTKFSKTYKVGKYLNSPQHPLYFSLAPDAYKFEYVICDGKYIYREEYRPADCEPIESRIRHFMAFLDKHNLTDIYREKWKIND